ncbi:MAG: polysaccharide biosynthesis protein [Brumimicrobium sp.]|nr:polysaccharide biosynthesis protein [Brumimicrobium sp.]
MQKENNHFLFVKNTPRWVVMLIDLAISLFALALAYAIRFDFQAKGYSTFKQWEYVSTVIPIFLFIKFGVFYLFKIHKGLVRHTSLEDVKRIFFSLLTFTLLIFLVGGIKRLFIDDEFLLPTSIVIIEFLVSLVLMIGLRFSLKIFFYEANKSKLDNRTNVIIYGAGDYGVITKRTIEKDPTINYKLIAFIDENKKLDKNRLEGLDIFHSSKLEELIVKHQVSELVVAIQSPNKSKLANIAEICLKHNVTVKRVPSFYKWINGEFSISQVRKINIDDLLGREPISLNLDEIKSELTDKVIMVTGAAGSIGSEIVRQVIEYKPKQVILLDQWESGLYDLQIDLRNSGKETFIEVVIGDVRDYDRMYNVFNKLQPNIVFHAAAYKHVPLMEDNPSESIKTNVLGSKNIVDLCDQFKVSKMVIISTDKAVNPTNVMGASKRIAEIYAQAKNKTSATQYVTTRFGNVLGSNGSVIPLFKKQIEKGGPVTVTDERVTRFFMTIPEACQLVLEAGVMGKGGEIFVFDMGEPIKIIDLAKKMIQLSDLTIGKDIELKIVGLRPGEKLYEELLADAENTIPTDHPQILKAKSSDTPDSILEDITELIELFKGQDNEQIVAKMKYIVPEYVSNNSIFSKLDK